MDTTLPDVRLLNPEFFEQFLVDLRAGLFGVVTGKDDPCAEYLPFGHDGRLCGDRPDINSCCNHQWLRSICCLSPFSLFDDLHEGIDARGNLAL